MPPAGALTSAPPGGGVASGSAAGVTPPSSCAARVPCCTGAGTGAIAGGAARGAGVVEAGVSAALTGRVGPCCCCCCGCGCGGGCCGCGGCCGGGCCGCCGCCGGGCCCGCCGGCGGGGIVCRGVAARRGRCASSAPAGRACAWAVGIPSLPEGSSHTSSSEGAGFLKAFIGVAAASGVREASRAPCTANGE